MRILIVGAGLGGLTLSAYLKKYGFDPVVIDKADDWKPNGFFIVLWPIGVKILEGIGVAGKVRDLGIKIPGLHLYKAKGGELTFFSYEDIIRKYGNPYSIDRAHLHKFLREANEDTEIKMKTSVSDIEQDKDGISVTFTDGSTDKFDLVVGSDGVNSQVRKMIFPKTKPRYLGCTSWIIWLPQSFGPQEKFVTVFGNGKVFNIYPTDKKGRLFGYFIMSSPPNAADPVEKRIQNLKEHFSDMGGIVSKVLEHLPHNPQEIYHHDNEQVDVKKWYQGRVALLGDAVHALSPLLGAGASMAMEDALVLAQEIKQGHKGNLQFILQKYATKRHNRIKEIQKRSNVFDYGIKIKLPQSMMCLKEYATKNFLKQYYYNTLNKLMGKSVVK